MSTKSITVDVYVTASVNLDAKFNAKLAKELHDNGFIDDDDFPIVSADTERRIERLVSKMSELIRDSIDIYGD